MSQQSSQTDLELWAKRLALFHDTAEGALQVLRILDNATFIEFLTREGKEWQGDVNNTGVLFPLNDEVRQDAFFKAVEGVCEAANRVPESDHHMYVLLLPSFPPVGTSNRWTGWPAHVLPHKLA